MKILIDMNLPPSWAAFLLAAGHEAVHWSQVGHATATDREIMAWAGESGHVVLSHDLDFSALIAATRSMGPSVIQIRAQAVLPDDMGKIVLGALGQFRRELEAGALVSVDPQRARARVLPLS